MFSPSVADGGPATATRSRRRQRPVSSESLVQQPKAKRQRLPLTEQTFLNPDAPQKQTQHQQKQQQQPPPPQHQPQQQPSQQEQDDNDTIEVKTDKSVSFDSQKENMETPHITPRRDLNVRAKKTKHGDRAANKGDGSLVLV